MWCRWNTVFVILSTWIISVHQQDFMETVSGFEFIYHEYQSLLLTVRNASCFFSHISGEIQQQIHDTAFRHSLELKVIDIVISDNQSFIFNASLDAMRDMYADRLADWHCFGKDVFALELMPPSTVTCDFESPTKPHCAFNPDLGADFAWTQGTGPTPTANTGPAKDHTSGTGHYMYIESSEPRLPGDMARLVSQVYSNPDGSPHCVRFFYHMYGSSIGSLHVYTVSDQPSAHLPPPVWSKSGDRGDQWKEAELEISPSGNFKVIFEGVVGPGFYGDIAIDDVSVSRGSCRPPMKCDFESSSDPWCGLEQDPSAVFNWTLHSGPTPSEGTGPATDHTLGPSAADPGSYIYIESSEPRRPGDTARVIKQVPAIADDFERCLGIFYHMHGAGIGTLNVYATTGNSLSQLPPPIWTKSGNQGDTWKGVNVTIPIATDFQLVFEGIIGNSSTSFLGDTAIDDITISEGACPQDSLVTTTSPGTPAHQISPCEVDNAAIFKCCFEDNETGGWCSFRQSTHDDFDWRHGQRQTATPNTGPHSDHSLGDQKGHFVYIDATSHAQNAVAALITQPFHTGNMANQIYCLKFHYHMYGSDMGSLHVHVTHDPDPYNRQQGSPIWMQDGDQGDQWREAVVDFYTVGQFEIYFEGIVGSGPYGDIAIDDMFLYRGSCLFKPRKPFFTVSSANNPSSHWKGEAGVLMWSDTPGGTQRVAMHDVHCSGHEASLFDCQYQESTDLHCEGHHDLDMGIYCGSPCHYNGHTYHDGQSFQDQACSDTCKCVDGHVHL